MITMRFVENMADGICDFNPRTREGCDPTPGRARLSDSSYFNPRTREGCDGVFNSTIVGIPSFQSTHP